MDLTQGRSAISFAWKETGFTNMKAGQRVEQAFPELETAPPDWGPVLLHWATPRERKHFHQHKFSMWDKLNIKHVCFKWQHYGKRNKIMWLNKRLLWHTEPFVVTTLQEQTLGSKPLSSETLKARMAWDGTRDSTNSQDCPIKGRFKH